MRKSRSSIRTALRVFHFAVAMLVLAGFCFAKTTITLSTAVGPPTTKLQVSGSGYAPSVKIDIYFDSKDVGLATANKSGSFSKVTISVPTMAQPGNHTIKASERQGAASAKATFLVRTDWAQFHRSNMQRWNQYENTLNVNNVGRLQLKWKANVNTSTDSPAVAGGVVYVGAGNREIGYVYALDAATGVQNWAYGNSHGFVSPPAVANGIVYIGAEPQGGPDDELFAINTTTGSFRWAFDFGAPVYSAPTVVNDVVYFIDDVGIYARDAATGSAVWTYSPPIGYGGSSSPTVINGVVYVGSEDQNLYALNAATGDKIWSYTTGQQVDSSPAVVNGVLYFGSDNVYALDATTGALIWLTYIGGSWSSPAIANSVLYIGSFDGNVYALNASTGAMLWNYTTGGQVQSSPAVANGVVYVGSDKLYALNASTGAKLWSYPIARPASPVVADGVVYVTNYEDGYLYAFGLK